MASNSTNGQKPTQIVLESTALVSYLQAFDNDLHPLRKLDDELGKCQYVIPDVVFYELTAILPTSLPQLEIDIRRAVEQEKHWDAEFNGRFADNPDMRENIKEQLGGGPLEQLIQRYVDASPRTAMRDGADYAGQLRALLRWYAERMQDNDRPSLVARTETGRHLCESLQTEYDLLGNRKDGKGVPESYMPDHSDLNSVLGEHFDYGNVNIHIGQLMLMGLVSEQEYKERMRKEETSGTRHRRFITVAELMELMTKHSPVPGKRLTQAMGISGPTKRPATMQHFLRNIDYLLSYEKMGPTMADIIAAPDQYMRKNGIDGGAKIARSTILGNLTHADLCNGLRLKDLISEGVIPWDRMSQAHRREVLQKTNLTPREIEDYVGFKKGDLKEIEDTRIGVKGIYHLRDRFDGKDAYKKLKDMCATISEQAAPALKHYFLHRMIGQSKLQIGTLVFGNVLPWTELDFADRLKLLSALGYPVVQVKEGAEGEDLLGRLQRAADDMGFFEQYVSLKDLDNLSKAFTGDSRFEYISLIGDGFRNKEYSHKREMFRKDCEDAKEGDKNPPYDRPPYIGTPYEKCFTDALVNGTLSVSTFLRLAVSTGGLKGPISEAGNNYGIYRTPNGSVELLFDRNEPERSKLRIKQDGAISRVGTTRIPQAGRETVARKQNGRGTDYYSVVSVQELLQDCRKSLRYKGHNPRSYRVFEALLYPVASTQATRLHETAQEMFLQDARDDIAYADGAGHPVDVTPEALADAKLTQIEKDFTNRHMRKWSNHTLPYESLFSGLHVIRRIARKNFGEIATAEVASGLAEKAGKRESVFIINHDGDLSFPEGDSLGQAQIRLGSHVYRLHSHMKDFLGSTPPGYGFEGEQTENTGTIRDRLHAASSGADRSLFMVNTKHWINQLADMNQISESRIKGILSDRKMGRNTSSRSDNAKWDAEVKSWQLSSMQRGYR